MNKKILITIIAGLIVIAGVAIFFVFHFKSDIKLTESSSGITIKYTNNAKSNNVANMISLTEDEILKNPSYSIVKGTVEDVDNIKISFGGFGDTSYGAIITLKVDEIISGSNVDDTIDIFVQCPIGTDVAQEDSDTVSTIAEDVEGIFIIEKYDAEETWEENGKILYMYEIAPYGMMDGERFAFIMNDDELVCDQIYSGLSKDSSLNDVKEYILNKIS